MAKRSKQGAGCLCYLIALAMIVLGICCPLIPGLYRYWKQPYTKQFLVPGSVEVQLSRGGDYTLWHDYRTILNGRSYSASTNLPAGLQISLKNRTTGESIAMYKRGDATFTSNSTSGAPLEIFTFLHRAAMLFRFLPR